MMDVRVLFSFHLIFSALILPSSNAMDGLVLLFIYFFF
jgi:hypothetical protein